jgi:hypothetical protein
MAFRKKKKKEGFNYKPRYSVQQDPTMTRWRNYYCNNCSTSKRHKKSERKKWDENQD